MQICNSNLPFTQPAAVEPDCTMPLQWKKLGDILRIKEVVDSEKLIF